MGFFKANNDWILLKIQEDDKKLTQLHSEYFVFIMEWGNK